MFKKSPLSINNNKKKVGQTISDNRPQKQIELSSEDNFDDWELQWQNERCRLRLFHVAFLPLSSSHAQPVSLWWSRYIMWPVDAHLGSRKTHFSYAFNLKRTTSPPGQGPALVLFIPFSHFFILQPIFLSSFLFLLQHSPSSRSPRPPPVAAVRKIIITHITILFFSFFFFFFYQIHFRMNDAENKNRNPQKSRTCTLSKNLLVGVKPVSVCEANEQASCFKAALMHESELVNCETTPSEWGLERAAETTTHTLTHTFRWILFQTVLWLFRGHEKSTCVGEGSGRRGGERWLPSRFSCWSSYSLTNCLWVCARGEGAGGSGEVIESHKAIINGGTHIA